MRRLIETLTENEIHDACALVTLADQPDLMSYDVAIVRAVSDYLAAPAAEARPEPCGLVDMRKGVKGRFAKALAAAWDAAPPGDTERRDLEMAFAYLFFPRDLNDGLDL